MTAAMELLYLVAFLLLTRPGVTFGDNNKQRVVVMEGSDVVLPCSINDTPLNYELFDWKKDGQKEVFLYDAGIHYNNGLGGQDPQFKGRVSHFEDELRNGNASIKISDTKLEDSGDYSCIFPRLQNQIFHIELIVEQRVVVMEGSDVVLPCSINDTPLNYELFDWKKDGQKEVFLYDAGIHYNNGLGGQDPQFKGRVSHFEDELRNGNASIKISDTKLEDSGDYSCIFPRLQNQIFHIELIVDPVLKKRNITGAAPEPSVRTLDQTADRALLQCAVKGAFPKPCVEWKDSAGKVLHSVVTHENEVNKRFDITLQTNVTQTGHYSCVVTQYDIGHQDYTETFVLIGPVVVEEGSDAVLPCSLGQKDLTNQLFDWKKDRQEVFLYDAGIHYNNNRTGQDPWFKDRVSHFEDELRNGNASIKISDTKVKDSGVYSCFFPHLQNQRFDIELVVGASPEPYVTNLYETADSALLECAVRGASPKPAVEWKDSAGKVLPAKVTHESTTTSKDNKHTKLSYITLQTNVTQTGYYNCVVTQSKIGHQVFSTIFVRIGDSTIWKVVAAVISVLFVAAGIVFWLKYRKLKRSLQERNDARHPPSELNSLRQTESS